MSVSDRLYGHPRLYAAWNGWRWTAQFLRGGKLLAALRQAWAAYIDGHDGETCERCGRSYFLWHSLDVLWAEVTGHRQADGQLPEIGEEAGGLYCPACFDREADRLGIILMWRPEVFRRVGGIVGAGVPKTPVREDIGVRIPGPAPLDFGPIREALREGVRRASRDYSNDEFADFILGSIGPALIHAIRPEP